MKKTDSCVLEFMVQGDTVTNNDFNTIEESATGRGTDAWRMCNGKGKECLSGKGTGAETLW